MSRTTAAWGLAAAIASGAIAAAASDPARGDEEAEQAARGRITYRVHCGSCHGGEGRGDGPMAEVLTVAPADLTRIRPDADGHFPAKRLHRVIDGRFEVPAHGSREMPVWGLSFQDRGRDSDQEAEVESLIRQLIAYLRSIQAPASGSEES